MPFIFPPRRSYQSGFTLVELLVVIAIVALMAAILFPVFSRARENARRSSCQTAMRFIGLGVRQYVRDFDEKLPLTVVNASPGIGIAYGWADAIVPYTGGAAQFQCPSEPNKPATVDSNSNGTLWDEAFSNDYAYNNNLSGISESDIPSAPSTIMLSENTASTDARNSFGDGTGTGIVNATAGSIRHLTGANYGFADGHMKFLLPTSVYGDGASVATVAYTYAN